MQEPPNPPYINKSAFRKLRKVISVVILTAFVVTSIKSPAYAQTAGSSIPWMPKPGTRLSLSPEFTPAHLKGMVIHPDNALQFDFIIYRGDESFSSEQKKVEYKKLIKYFLASLAVPDENQWVNLSPYEKDRIIKDDFGKTEMGRDLLAQDYILKQITASLIYPESNLGQKFWDKIYSQAQEQFGTTNIPVNTFNKVWIVPDEAYIYEHGNTVYIVKQHLKVMLEQDYLSLSKHAGIASKPTAEVNKLGSQVVREIVLPALEKEVNEGKNFAMLRQVYSGMLLAAWYKRTLKESLLGKIYADQAKVKGVDQDPRNNEEIYQQYLKAFKKGVFNYIKEDVDKYTNEAIPRKYFSGGANGMAIRDPQGNFIDVYGHIVHSASGEMVSSDPENGSRLEDAVVDLLGDHEGSQKSPVNPDHAMKASSHAIPGIIQTSYQQLNSAVSTNAHHLARILDQLPVDSTLKATTVFEKISGRTYSNRDFYPGYSDISALKFKDQLNGSFVEEANTKINSLGAGSFATRTRGIVGYEVTPFTAREKVYSLTKKTFYNLNIVIQPDKSVPHVDTGRNAGIWLTLREMTEDQLREFQRIMEETPEALAYYFKASERRAFQQIYDGFIEPGLAAGFYNLGDLDSRSGLEGVKYDQLQNNPAKVQTIKANRNTELTRTGNRYFYTMDLETPILQNTRGGSIKKVTLKSMGAGWWAGDNETKVQVNSLPVDQVIRANGWDMDITSAVLETMKEAGTDQIRQIVISAPRPEYLTTLNISVERDSAMTSSDELKAGQFGKTLTDDDLLKYSERDVNRFIPVEGGHVLLLTPLQIESLYTDSKAILRNAFTGEYVSAKQLNDEQRLGTPAGKSTTPYGVFLPQADNAMVSKDIENYVEGLRTGKYAFRLDLKGQEAAALGDGQREFDPSFAKFYETLKARIIDNISRQKLMDKDAIYSEAKALLKELQAKDQAMTAEDVKKNNRYTILVAEDDKTIGETIEFFIPTMGGFQVEVANDGQQGLEKVKENPGKYLAVFTDYNMPNMNGADFARAIQEVDPNLKVIIHSGDDYSALRKENLPSNVVNVLQKPSSIQEVLPVLNNMRIEAQKNFGSDEAMKVTEDLKTLKSFFTRLLTDLPEHLQEGDGTSLQDLNLGDEQTRNRLMFALETANFYRNETWFLSQENAKWSIQKDEQGKTTLFIYSTAESKEFTFSLDNLIDRISKAVDTMEGSLPAAAQKSTPDSVNVSKTDDNAMKGGIDLNSANLNLQIKRDGNGVPLPVSQQDLSHLNIDGLIPVIMEIKPAAALPIFSQLNSSSSANG